MAKVTFKNIAKINIEGVMWNLKMTQNMEIQCNSFIKKMQLKYLPKDLKQQLKHQLNYQLKE